MQSHDANSPLFLYMAFQNVHFPVQAPKKHTDKYAFIKDTLRRTYAGMVDIMDEAVGNITDAFKEAGYLELYLISMLIVNFYVSFGISVIFYVFLSVNFEGGGGS